MKKIIKNSFTIFFISLFSLLFFGCSHQQKRLSHMKLRENIDGFQTLISQLPFPTKTEGIIYGDAHVENFVWIRSSDQVFPNDFDSVKSAFILSDFYRLLLSADTLYELNKDPQTKIANLKAAYIKGLTASDLKATQPRGKNPQSSRQKFFEKKDFERDLSKDELEVLRPTIRQLYPEYSLTDHYLRVKKTGGSRGKKRFQLWLKNPHSPKNLWIEFKEQDPKDKDLIDKMNFYFQNNYFDPKISFVQLNQTLYIQRAREQFENNDVIDLNIKKLSKNLEIIEKEFTALGLFHQRLNSSATINNIVFEIRNIDDSKIWNNILFLRNILVD